MHEAFMKSVVALFGSILLALLAGCATSSNQVQPSAKQDALAQNGQAKPYDPDEIICVTERVVGTNIPEKVCRTRGSMDANRDATQIMMQTINNKNALRGN
jgi:hypothetical protein